jgi:hypothetical protein
MSASLDLVMAVDVSRMAAALVPDLQQLAGLAGGEHHPPGAIQRVGHLLLAIHVQPGPEAIDSLSAVPEVRRGNDDRIESLLFFQHLAVVVIAIHGKAALRQLVDRAFETVLRPDIADRTESQTRDPQHGIEQHRPLGPGANQGHVQLPEVPYGDAGPQLGRLLRLLIHPLLVHGVPEQAEHRDRSDALEKIPTAQCFRWFPTGIILLETRFLFAHGSLSLLPCL